MPSSLSRRPQPLSKAPKKELRAVQAVCFDIDDTFSTRGKLTASAYQSLWKLHRAGIATVAVTGRPAGWCDHIARFWPVHAVIGENGAFTFYMKDGVRQRLETLSLPRSQSQSRMNSLKQAILEAFPHARWASDQAYREYDLAIDFCEDVPPWPETDVQRLLQVCAQAGAHAKRSSIHVNAWFGEYDKFTGFTRWREKGCPGAPQPLALQHCLYIGDSPNDEPLFERFEKSVGVANLGPFLNDLRFPPTWITSKESGSGFSELAQKILS